MNEKIVVARKGMDLGSLLPAEAAELLQAGFLKPTDSWRWGNADAWLPLGQLPQEPAPASLTKRLQTKLTEAAQSAATGATQITAKLKTWVGQGQNQLTLSSRQMLEGFVPQLQKLVAHHRWRGSFAGDTVNFAPAPRAKNAKRFSCTALAPVGLGRMVTPEGKIGIKQGFGRMGE
jgi:hypothetical protein